MRFQLQSHKFRKNNGRRRPNSAMKMRRRNTFKLFDVSIEKYIMRKCLLLAHVHQTTGKTTKDNNPLRQAFVGKTCFARMDTYIFGDGGWTNTHCYVQCIQYIERNWVVWKIFLHYPMYSCWSRALCAKDNWLWIQ